jgi:hypothetical protein
VTEVARKVHLRASGYTWRCPECDEKDNYTGAPPAKVVCKRCKAVFDVGDLRHRRCAKIEEKDRNHPQGVKRLP